MKFILVIDLDGKFHLLNSRYIVSVETVTHTGGKFKGETFTRIDYKRSIQASTLVTRMPFEDFSNELKQEDV